MQAVSSPHSVDGLNVPKFVLQEHVDKLKQLQLYEDDVWIVGYPKTGTNWTQHIVRMILNGGKPDDRKISDAVPWLEATPSIPINDKNFDAFCPTVSPDNMPRPRAFKTHFPYHLLPCGSPDKTLSKYIYIARNPKDVVVSLYCMLKTYSPDMEWDGFFDAYVEGKIYYGSYVDHLLSWWPHRNDKNVLFLKYEDMKKNLKHSITQIASFIGKELPDDMISEISDSASFEKMKKDSTTNYSWDKVHDKDGEPMFLRKGIVGDWKNFLSAEQSAKMDAICAERLGNSGLKFDYV